MTLFQVQKLFPHLITQLYEWCWNHGYEITGGEWWRSDTTAQLDEQEGKGISNSLHRLRIAQDLNLFQNDIYLLTQPNAIELYKPAGQFWESLSTSEYQTAWGGRFGDADHFSIQWHNVR